MPKSHFLAIASDAKNKIVAARALPFTKCVQKGVLALTGPWTSCSGSSSVSTLLVKNSSRSNKHVVSSGEVLVLVSGRKPKSDSRSLNLLEVLSGKAAPWWYTKSGLLSKVLFKSWQNFSRASAVANLVRSTEQGLARLSFPHPKL